VRGAHHLAWPVVADTGTNNAFTRTPGLRNTSSPLGYFYWWLKTSFMLCVMLHVAKRGAGTSTSWTGRGRRSWR